jgi:hypothetical protein
MAQYAEKTGVSSAGSRDEIERTLKRYGATAFAYGWDEQVATVMEQACRQRWRALSLVIKAKLEAVEAQISTVETEFLAQIVLPNGSSVGEWAAPQLALAYASGQMPALMPGGSR